MRRHPSGYLLRRGFISEGVFGKILLFVHFIISGVSIFVFFFIVFLIIITTHCKSLNFSGSMLGSLTLELLPNLLQFVRGPEEGINTPGTIGTA